MLVGLNLDPARTQMVSGFVDTYLKLQEAEKQEFQAELDKIVEPQQKEGVMKIVTSWMEEGIEQGRREGKVELVLKLIAYRFGQVSSQVEAQVQKLSEAQVENLAQSLFGFTQVTELQTWLDQNKPQPSVGEE